MINTEFSELEFNKIFENEKVLTFQKSNGTELWKWNCWYTFSPVASPQATSCTF